MTILKKDLQTLQKEIQALEKTMKKLIAAAEKGGKPKVAKKTNSVPVKKTPAKNVSAKRKASQPKATDQVLKIINRSKKGVNVATLMTKTGFNQKKISNIIQRIYKQGKITRVGKGIYMRA